MKCQQNGHGFSELFWKEGTAVFGIVLSLAFQIIDCVNVLPWFSSSQKVSIMMGVHSLEDITQSNIPDMYQVGYDMKDEKFVASR